MIRTSYDFALLLHSQKLDCSRMILIIFTALGTFLVSYHVILLPGKLVKFLGNVLLGDDIMISLSFVTKYRKPHTLR